MKISVTCDFIIKALEADGMLLGMIPERLRNYSRYVDAAVKQNKEAIKYASDRLQTKYKLDNS